MVAPTRLLMLDASQYERVGGVQKLQQLAGLDQISTAVPADFIFTFEQK